MRKEPNENAKLEKTVIRGDKRKPEVIDFYEKGARSLSESSQHKILEKSISLSKHEKVKVNVSKSRHRSTNEIEMGKKSVRKFQNGQKSETETNESILNIQTEKNQKVVQKEQLLREKVKI